MSIGATQRIKTSTYIADEAITKYAAVTTGDIQGHCRKPSAAKILCLGIAQNSATASGDTVEVMELGDSYVIAYATGIMGKEIAIADTTGRVSTPSGFASGDFYVGFYKEAPSAQDNLVLASINITKLIR